MSVQNFSFLAGLEVTEKFVCGGGVVCGGFQVVTVSNLNPSYLKFLWVELWLGFDTNKSQVTGIM